MSWRLFDRQYTLQNNSMMTYARRFDHRDEAVWFGFTGTDSATTFGSVGSVLGPLPRLSVAGESGSRAWSAAVGTALSGPLIIQNWTPKLRGA